MFKKIEVGNDILRRNKDNPLFLPIFGLIKNCQSVELFCDGEESSLALIAEKRICCLAGGNFQFFKVFCESLKGHMVFCGVSDEILNFLKENYTIEWTNPCKLFVYNGKPFDYIPDPRVKSLEAKYWQRVSDGTFYHAAQSDIEECIKNRKSSAVYVDGEPVCWCLMHIENSLGMLCTLPKYRRQGFALTVMKDLTKKVLDDGETPYAFIVESNEVSAVLAGQYNFEYKCNATWCGIDFEEKKCR